MNKMATIYLEMTQHIDCETRHCPVCNTVLLYNSTVYGYNCINCGYASDIPCRKVIIGTFLTNYQYPFFKYHAPPDGYIYTLKWVESILKLGLDAILLLDKKNADIESYLHGTKIQVDYIDEYRRGINQMDGRWSILEKYISSHPSIGAFFITDTGDVTVLKDPFVFIEHNKIYIGDEMINADCGFMAERVKAISKKSCTINYENGYKNKQLLNCGIFGGYREKPLEALRKSVAKLDWYDCPKECVDMVAFNEVLYSAGCYDNLIVHGKPLNTEFWKWDYNNTECYFQHK